MNKPKNYDETQTSFERLAPGAHSAIIKDVVETTSQSGRQMIAVSIDFASDDPQAGFFKKAYDADTRAEKKWPYRAVQYILVNDSEGNTSRSFKAFCTAYEDSNGLHVQWGDDFGRQFRGRKIGVVYGEVEEEYEGSINTRTRIRWFCDVHKLMEQGVPEKKLLNISAPLATATSSGEDWMNIPDGGENGLPFR